MRERPNLTERLHSAGGLPVPASGPSSDHELGEDQRYTHTVSHTLFHRGPWLFKETAEQSCGQICPNCIVALRESCVVFSWMSVFSWTGSTDGASAERPESPQQTQTLQTSQREPAVSSSTNQSAARVLKEWVQLKEPPPSPWRTPC